ncbi:MIB [Mytilus edulis]|uniref:MIB n=1 Tax=Mytilus edulis TaxID=6550 RepID=A0A8S3SDA7_MYTED|nr:MIB [Mytilus edulis]
MKLVIRSKELPINTLKAYVEENNLQRRTAHSKPLEDSDISFPQLTDEQLRSLTCGVYQLKLSPSYIQEYMEGDSQICFHKDAPDLLRIRIQSRHVSSKKYFVWIKYSESEVNSWYCLCHAGARIVVVCVNGTVIIWYLSSARNADTTSYGVKDWSTVQVTPRENLVSKAAFGILRDSFVRQRSQSTKEKYKVQNILVDIIWTYRSDAEVKLDDGFNTIKEYRVGRMGQCHLKFSKAAMGHWYYENHLPIVQNGNVQKGARVVRGPEWDINDNVDGGHGYVGTVTNIKNSTNNNVTVQWDNGETATYSCSSKNKTLRLFDNGPSGVKHKNNFCDRCPTDRSIRGIRWKCKHCAEFDLCNECYMSAKDDHSNHPFDRIIAPDLKDNDDDNMFIRSDSTNIRKLSYGIFKSAEVVAIDNDDGNLCY